MLNPTLAEAYEHCEQISRTCARNFFYGIRLLPAEKRRAMCAAYAFARWVDDIGDGDLDSAEKHRQLAQMRGALAALERGDASGPLFTALADATRRFALPVEAMSDLIDGVEMDVLGTQYETSDDLVVYCRRVAGSVGRLCLAIFGTRDPNRAIPLSDDLGVALQLTNILRDVGQDLALGRVYLPAEHLRRFGCADFATAREEDVATLVRFEAADARRWFERGLRLLELLDRRSAGCAAAMSGIYSRLLRRIEQQPTAVLHTRISLPGWEKAWIATRSLTVARR